MKSNTKNHTRLPFDLKKFLFEKRHNLTSLASLIGTTHATLIECRTKLSITIPIYHKLKEKFEDIDTYIE